MIHCAQSNNDLKQHQNLIWLSSLGTIFSKSKKRPEFIYSCFSPPLPIKHNYYRCDKLFHTESIESLYQEHETIGAVIILGEEEQMYKITGTKVKRIQSNKLNRQKAQKKGGQSAPRIQRIQKSQVKHYVNYICEQITENFWEPTANRTSVKHILLSGADHLCKQVKTLLPEYPFLQPPHYISDIKELIGWGGDATKASDKNRTTNSLNKLFERMEALDPLILYGKEEIETNMYRIKFIYSTKEIETGEYSPKKYIVKDSKQLSSIGGAIAVAYYAA